MEFTTGIYNFEGKLVSGVYFGVPFTGLCTESRVAAGGRMKHYINLDEPIPTPSADVYNELAEEITISQFEDLSFISNCDLQLLQLPGDAE